MFALRLLHVLVLLGVVLFVRSASLGLASYAHPDPLSTEGEELGVRDKRGILLNSLKRPLHRPIGVVQQPEPANYNNYNTYNTYNTYENHNTGGGHHGGHGSGHGSGGGGGPVATFAQSSAGSISGGGHGHKGQSNANSQSASYSFGPFSASFSASHANGNGGGFFDY